MNCNTVTGMLAHSPDCSASKMSPLVMRPPLAEPLSPLTSMPLLFARCAAAGLQTQHTHTRTQACTGEKQRVSSSLLEEGARRHQSRTCCPTHVHQQMCEVHGAALNLDRWVEGVLLRIRGRPWCRRGSRLVTGRRRGSWNHDLARAVGLNECLSSSARTRQVRTVEGDTQNSLIHRPCGCASHLVRSLVFHGDRDGLTDCILVSAHRKNMLGHHTLVLRRRQERESVCL